MSRLLRQPGLGSSCHATFAREGAVVVGTARREGNVQQVVDELCKEGDCKVLALHQDVSLREDWEAVVRSTVERYGVLYLASDEARCVTGTELVVDCGHLII